jgi:hypothetical protein
MRVKKFLILPILAFMIFADGCQQQQGSASKEQSTMDKALTMIEKGKNDDAISLLTAELKKHPGSNNIREILASAYANRAGIRVENYYGFTISYDSLIKGPQDFLSPTPEQLQVDLSQVFPGLPPDMRNALQNFSTNLYIIQTIHNRIKHIPLVNDDQAKDLLSAIDTLEPATAAGAHIYRAILEIIVLRASFEQDNKLLKAATSGANCKTTFDLAVQSVQFSFELLEQMLADVSKAYPSKADDMVSTKNQLSSVLADLPDKAQKTRLLLCPGA